MGKKRSASMSKRIKTRHKKTNTKRLPIENVSLAIRDINKTITSQVSERQTVPPNQPSAPSIELETVSLATLRQLTGNP